MAATVLTAVAETDPVIAAGNADAVGVVGSIATMGAVANAHLKFTGVVPGVAFSVAVTVTGSVGAIAVTVAESATGYDLSIANLSTTGTGTGTANQIIAAFNADPVASKIAVASLAGADTGAGVQNVAITKTNSTGQVSPDLVSVGTEQASLDVANGNSFANTGRERVLIANTDAGTALVTITSTSGSTVKTFEIDAAKFVNVNLPLATWGAAPVITGIDTGLKLAVIGSPSLAEEQAGEVQLIPGASATTSINDVVSLLQTLRDDAGANSLEKKVYRRLLHLANVGSRRITGTDQRLAGGNHDTL